MLEDFEPVTVPESVTVTVTISEFATVTQSATAIELVPVTESVDVTEFLPVAAGMCRCAAAWICDTPRRSACKGVRMTVQRTTKLSVCCGI